MLVDTLSVPAGFPFMTGHEPDSCADLMVEA
jgi:hypothetical protein